MYEQIYKLKFQGAAFSNETTLPFFSTLQQRMCIVYGRNGSGKSTIAKAIVKAKGIDLPEISSANFLSAQGLPVALTDDVGTHRVYVFNENYIQKNVRLKEDGLSTIVMFGQQGELEDRITRAQVEYEQADALRTQQAELCEKYHDRNSVLAPDYYISKMNLALSGDANWSGRERLITGARRNASVSDNTYVTIVANVPTQSEADTRKLYQEKYVLLKAVKDGNAKLDTQVNTCIELTDRENEILGLLAQLIERPELSEREEYLLSITEKGQFDKLFDMQNVFDNPSVKTCPFCLQSISNDYRLGLIDSIKKILSKEVENHKETLLAMKFELISFDFGPFAKLPQEVLNNCETALKDLNEAITQCNQSIQNKVDCPFTPIADVAFGIKDKLSAFTYTLEILEAARKEYNAPFDNANNFQRELQHLNKEQAYYELIDLYNSYLNQAKEKRKEDEKLLGIMNEVRRKKQIVDDLIQQKKNICIAVDIINSNLRYVFFATHRLEINVEGDAYCLLSNGQKVKPSDVSVGERNVIALCYFFTEMLSNLNVESGYTEEMLIVIDDPISSFDMENRIGIMSFLRAQLNEVMCGNMNTKLIILTHDLSAVFDIEKAFEEVKESAKNKFGSECCTYCLLELTHKTLSDFRYKKRNEYSELLKMVYDYASSGNVEYEIIIGNVMRRTLETFSTFVYRKGIDKISCDENILDTLELPEYKTYFQNLMYRLILNGESHMEERTRTIVDAEFFGVLSPEEKQRTAKDILCFLYLLNPVHILAHLDGLNTAEIEATITTWCDNIVSFSHQ